MIKEKQKLIFVSVLLCILVIAGVYGIFHLGESNTPPKMEEDAVEWAGSEDKNNNSGSPGENIAVPGTDVMNMKADQKKQSVNLYNPEQNNCYFKISLLLEDGTLLYQSDLIAPGKGIYEIELAKALAEGTYDNSILKYECFDMDENYTPLNAAEFVFTIQSTP